MLPSPLALPVVERRFKQAGISIGVVPVRLSRAPAVAGTQRQEAAADKHIAERGR